MWTGGTSPNAYTTGMSLAAVAQYRSLPAGAEAVVVAVVVADTRSAPVVAVVVVQAISVGAAVAVVFQR